MRPVARGYQYQLEAHNDEIDEIMQLIVQNIEDLGLPLRTIEDEWGPSQIEVTFAPMRGIEAADAMLLFRTAVKQICKRHGYLATFMCRPRSRDFSQVAGICINHWLILKQVRIFLCRKWKQNHSQSLENNMLLVSLKHARASTVFTTPTINGYKRFKPNSLAPDRAGWGVDNRGTMIRVLGGYGD